MQYIRLVCAVSAILWPSCRSQIGSCDKTCVLSSDLEACKELLTPPWSKYDRPAPPPSGLAATWYVYTAEDNTSAIALNVTWQQNGAAVKQYVEGYFVGISILGSFGSHKYKFNVKKPKLTNQMTSFYFDCFGKRNGKLVTTDTTFIIAMHALPMYQEGTDNQAVETMVDIPGCERDEIKGTRHCREEEDYKDFDDYYFDPYPDEELPTDVLYPSTTADLSKYTAGVISKIIMAAVCSALGVLLVIGTVLMIRYCTNCHTRRLYFSGRSESKTAAKTNSCLVLVSTSNGAVNTDEVYCNAVGALSDVLKQQPGIDVMCNLWEHINMHDPVEWTSDHISKYKNIVLVWTPAGKQNWLKYDHQRPERDSADPFIMCTNMLLRRVKNRKLLFCKIPRYHVVYFDQKPHCIPEQFRKPVECRQLTQKFRKFYLSVAGKAFDHADSDAYKKLQQLALQIQKHSDKNSCQDSDPHSLETVLTHSRMESPAVVRSVVHDKDAKTDDNIVVVPLNPKLDDGTFCLSASTWYGSDQTCDGSDCSCHALDTFKPESFDYSEV